MKKSILRKVGLFGIGLWALTEEKITEYSKELIENGDLNKEEGKKFVKEILEEQKKQKDDMEAKISSKVQETMRKAESVKDDELTTLKQQIQDLQNKIDSMMEKKGEGKESMKWRGSSMNPHAGEDLSAADNIKNKISNIKEDVKSKADDIKLNKNKD